jgi:hypothetical protein
MTQSGVRPRAARVNRMKTGKVAKQFLNPFWITASNSVHQTDTLQEEGVEVFSRGRRRS